MITGEHCVVAIGASAGGLEAIHEFFDHMPGKSNLSFVIIQHLSPDYKSLLVDLVSKHTDMQVMEAGENMELRKNCIYVIPNNKLMSVEKNRLVLEAKKQNHSPNTAIDFFLFSLAKAKNHRSIAVILSGTGSDGTRGIEAIKKAGGVVFVQDPLTAKFDGMPHSAIQSGNADHVLRPSEMPDEIATYLQNPSIDIERIDEAILEEIFRLVHEHNGNDFHYYKLPTITRRISRRMGQLEIDSIDKYLEKLRQDPEECKLLGNEFLIGVTKFFRDNEAFDALNKEVFEKLIETKKNDESIKIWICACSTGEEAYSIAISVDHLMQQMGKDIDVKIFATDIDQASIDIASKGCYPVSIENDIPSEILNKYFVRKGSNYQIIPAIRKQVVFAKHNILKDPPFINNDLVCCRNMLIYMSPVLQQKVLALLVYAVSIDKYLFLGSSENSTLVKDYVTEVQSKAKIYRKTRESRPASGYIPDTTPRKLSRTDKRYPSSAPDPAKPRDLWDDLQSALEEDLNFAAFYIDESFNIRDSAGSYGKFLTLPRKNLELNLLSMVPTELYLTLSAETKKSIKENRTINLKNIKYQKNELVYSWHVLIKPTKPYTLIVITETEVIKAEDAPPLPAPSVSNSGNEYVKSLESELTEVKGHLQYAIEDLETTNEELQSSNEELLSANEELQSGNEELQSLNEELHTLNTEHQIKIRELLELNDDLNNYFRSVDIGQVFLDKTLLIRKFNPAAVSTINLIDSDIGRPVFHISNNIRYDGFMNDLESVLKTNEIIEKEVSLSDGKNVLMRMMPYLTREKINSGVIISFVDITLITNLNNIIRTVLNSNPSIILAFAAQRQNKTIIDFTVNTANEAANVFLPENRAATELSFKNDLPLLNGIGLFERFTEIVNTGKRASMDLFVPGNNRWYNLVAAKMLDGIVTTFTDITAKKLSEEKLKKNYTELITVKDNLKKVNEDLEGKVIERTRALAGSEERFRLVARATNDALWDWDFVNDSTWLGETFFTLFGYHDHQDKPVDRKFLTEKIHPDDLQRVEKSLGKAINSGNTQFTEEYRFRKEDGTYAHILDRAYVMHDEFGTPYRMLGSLFDITSIKHAEEKVTATLAQRKFLAESMPLIVLTADNDGKLNFVNRQFENYTGVSYKQALGDGWRDLVAADDLDELLEQFDHALENKSDFSQEIRLRHRSGELRWNMLRGRVSKNTEGELSDFVITISDIHEHKVMNQLLEKKVAERTKKLNELNQALEVSNHDLLQFASVASHDLQEPVRKIQMYSKMIADRYGKEFPDAMNTYFSKILHAASRMRMLITDVLNYSRLSASDNNFELTDLNALLRDTLEDFEILVKEKSARISIDDLPDIEVNPGQIRQVFHNLVSNGLKFTREGINPEITIRFDWIPDNDFNAQRVTSGPWVRIKVEDNGIGFPPEYAADIFNLFKRLNSKDRFEGTGIGLAITQKIIEKHSGMIKAEGAEGLGARFIIILPLRQQLAKPQQEDYDTKTTRPSGRR